jgi:hypothetical protein
MERFDFMAIISRDTLMICYLNLFNIYICIYTCIYNNTYIYMCVQDIISSRGVPRAIIWDHPVDDPHGGHLWTVPAWRTFSGVSGLHEAGTVSNGGITLGKP